MLDLSAVAFLVCFQMSILSSSVVPFHSLKQSLSQTVCWSAAAVRASPSWLTLFLFSLPLSPPPSSPQSQPEMEYSPPELQAPRSNVADKPWPQVHSHTQRPHGENMKPRHT